MQHHCRALIPAAVIAAALCTGEPLRADDGGGLANRYAVTVLTSDLPGAAHTDPLLQNAWGVVFTPGASPFWIADNATGCSTLYDGQGTPQTLQVKIPLPPAPGTIPPTACVSLNPAAPINPTPTASQSQSTACGR